MSKPTIKGKWLEVIIDEQSAGKPVEQILKQELAFSGRSIQKLTRSKGIFLNRKAPFLQKKAKKGDLLRILIGDREEGNIVAQDIPIDVCYEDEEILIVNKQPGIMVHPIKPGQQGTLANAIAHYWAGRGTVGKVRPVHRLDKDTSGLILIAKNGYIHQLLDLQLRENVIQREYMALVRGHLEHKEGTIREPIGQDRVNPVKRRVAAGGEESVTHYQVLEEYTVTASGYGLSEHSLNERGLSEYSMSEHSPSGQMRSAEEEQSEKVSLVQVRLETGRTHQIRVHMSYIGYPVIGDTLYGRAHPLMKRQALHACKLTFLHPFEKKSLHFEAALPEDMGEFVQHLTGVK